MRKGGFPTGIPQNQRNVGRLTPCGEQSSTRLGNLTDCGPKWKGPIVVFRSIAGRVPPRVGRMPFIPLFLADMGSKCQLLCAVDSWDSLAAPKIRAL